MRRQVEQIPRTILLSGHLRTDKGELGEQVRIEYWNRGRLIQVVMTDLQGNFTFNFDPSRFGSSMGASDASLASPPVGGPQSQLLSSGIPGRPRDMNDLIRGGEVHVSVGGYYPVSKPFMGPLDSTGLYEVGSITLQKLSTVEGSTISSTSLAAPRKVRKEYDKARRLPAKNKLDEAEARLLKGVAIYPEHAAAWNLLGQIYQQKNQPEMAREAFAAAIKADPKYTSPYLGQAMIEIGAGEYEKLLSTTASLIKLDSTIGLAHYYNAVVYYSLCRFSEAEKSAQLSLQSLHKPPPVAHYLMANLLVRRRGYEEAIRELHVFLRADPASPQTEGASKLLNELTARIEKSENSAASGSKSGT